MSEHDKSYNAQMVPGTRVQLSGVFLKATGQMLGGEGQSVWTVTACSCRLCKEGLTVATDEIKDEAELRLYYTPAELQLEPHLRVRHILRQNLAIAGTLTIRNSP